jgi:hypothetical protein
MAIDEKNALELVFSYTVTPGDTEVFIEGMDNLNDTYLLVLNNVADADDGASLTMVATYNNNSQVVAEVNYAGRQNLNGTVSNQSGINQVAILVNYGTTGASYETNGHVWFYPQANWKAGAWDVRKYISKMITYNDTNLINHDVFGEFGYSLFEMNGVRLYPNSGAWDSGEFKLYKLRSGN